MDMVISMMFRIPFDTFLVETHPYRQSIFQEVIPVTKISTMRIDINHCQDTLDQYRGTFRKGGNRKICLSLLENAFKQKRFYMSFQLHRERD